MSTRHPLTNIAEWRKGCSLAPKESPAQCGTCTESLIKAVENWFAERRAAQPTRIAEILEELDALPQGVNVGNNAGVGDEILPTLEREAAKTIRALEAELYAAQDQITGLQALLESSDKALANAQRAIPGEGLIPVNAAHLRTVLSALLGMPHQIRELQATTRLPGSPIAALIEEFNSWSGHV